MDKRTTQRCFTEDSSNTSFSLPEYISSNASVVITAAGNTCDTLLLPCGNKNNSSVSLLCIVFTRPTAIYMCIFNQWIARTKPMKNRNNVGWGGGGLRRRTPNRFIMFVFIFRATRSQIRCCVFTYARANVLISCVHVD